jgi:hypothetical protein
MIFLVYVGRWILRREISPKIVGIFPFNVEYYSMEYPHHPSLTHYKRPSPAESPLASRLLV